LQDKDLRSKFNQAVFEDMIQDLANFDSIDKSCKILKQASDILPHKSNAKKGWSAFDEINLKKLATNWNHAKTEFEQLLSSKCDNELVNQAHDRMKLARKTYQQACKTAKQLFTQSVIDRANNKKMHKANGKQQSNLSLASPDITENQLTLLTCMTRKGTRQKLCKTTQKPFKHTLPMKFLVAHPNMTQLHLIHFHNLPKIQNLAVHLPLMKSILPLTEWHHTKPQERTASQPKHSKHWRSQITQSFMPCCVKIGILMSLIATNST
jgi:hypothetical protein